MKKDWATIHLTESVSEKTTPYALNIPFDEEGIIRVEEGTPYEVIRESERFGDEFHFAINIEIKHVQIEVPFIFESKQEAIEEGWKFD